MGIIATAPEPAKWIPGVRLSWGEASETLVCKYDPLMNGGKLPCGIYGMWRPRRLEAFVNPVQP